MAGVGLVVWGWAIVGMLVETYGFWLLFAGFVPTALSFLRRIPIFGRILDLPLFKKVIYVVLASVPKRTHLVTVDTPCCRQQDSQVHMSLWSLIMLYSLAGAQQDRSCSDVAHMRRLAGST